VGDANALNGRGPGAKGWSFSSSPPLLAAFVGKGGTEGGTEEEKEKGGGAEEGISEQSAESPRRLGFTGVGYMGIEARMVAYLSRILPIFII
jgi:hypothetical protein